MKVISFITQKGGVGKTTTTLHMGAAIKKWHQNLNTLVIDLDPQGNLSSTMDINTDAPTWADYFTKRLDLEHIIIDTDLGSLIPCNETAKRFELELSSMNGREFKLKKLLSRIEEEFNFDVVLIDCPPSFGLLTLNALCASDKVYTPLQMESFAKDGMDQFFASVNEAREDLDCEIVVGGIIRTMARKDLIGYREVQQFLDENYPDSYLQTEIRRNVDLSHCNTKKASVFDFAPKSNGSLDYQELTNEILQLEELNA